MTIIPKQGEQFFNWLEKHYDKLIWLKDKNNAIYDRYIAKLEDYTISVGYTQTSSGNVKIYYINIEVPRQEEIEYTSDDNIQVDRIFKKVASYYQEHYEDDIFAKLNNIVNKLTNSKQLNS